MEEKKPEERLSADEYLRTILRSDITNGDIFRCIWSNDTPEGWQMRLAEVYNRIDDCLNPLLEDDASSNWPAIAEVLFASGLMILSHFPWLDGAAAPGRDNPAARKEHVLRILNIVMPTVIKQTFRAFEASGRKHRAKARRSYNG